MTNLEKFEKAAALRSMVNVRPAGYRPHHAITDNIRLNKKLLNRGNIAMRGNPPLSPKDRRYVQAELDRLIQVVKDERAAFKPGQHWEMFLGNKPAPIGRLSMHGTRRTIDYGRDSVSKAWIDPKFRGMGLGKKLYGDVLRQIPGNKLVSPITSGRSTNIWQGFGKRNPKYHLNQTLYHPSKGSIIIRRRSDGVLVADDAPHQPMLRQQIGPPPDRFWRSNREPISDPAVLAGRPDAMAAAERLQARLAGRIDPDDMRNTFGSQFAVKLNLPKHMRRPTEMPPFPVIRQNTAERLKPKAASTKKNISREHLLGIIEEIAEAKKIHMPRRGRPVAAEPLHIKYGPRVHFGRGRHGTHVAREGQEGGTEHLYKDRVFIGDSRGGYGRKLHPEEIELVRELIKSRSKVKVNEGLSK